MRKSERLNGANIPYDSDVDLLRSQLVPPGPQAWASCWALGHHPSHEAFEVLVELTSSTNWSYRRAAAEAISFHKLGRTASELLRTLLDDISPYVIRTACESISKLELHELHDSLLPLLTSHYPYTRQTALSALATLWTPSDFEHVFSIYNNDPSSEVKKQAAQAMRSNANEENWEKLFHVWKQSSLPRHRVWACELATQFAKPGFESELRQLSEDRDGHVRKAARHAIEKLTNREITSS